MYHPVVGIFIQNIELRACSFSHLSLRFLRLLISSPSSLSRVPLSLLHWRHLLTEGLHLWEVRRNEVRGGAATLRAQGKGVWERRGCGTTRAGEGRLGAEARWGEGPRLRAARPGHARHRQGRRPPPSRRTRGPLAAHTCCGSVQHRRKPTRCRGRAAGRGRATGEGGAARPRMAGRAGRGGEGWQSMAARVVGGGQSGRSGPRGGRDRGEKGERVAGDRSPASPLAGVTRRGGSAEAGGSGRSGSRRRRCCGSGGGGRRL
ncbi:hypothetical protein PVAP13_4NG138201 [Panicum virgatum]|uniref:Uncharacterized protein n=1 Tax=Panicum virgatum TaxID=38727 RepID=A0A8T0T8G9_PANVG|nr:hypothetical protein PVAP13_4NG138201 [Panicum virgatum]